MKNLVKKLEEYDRATMIANELDELKVKPEEESQRIRNLQHYKTLSESLKKEIEMTLKTLRLDKTDFGCCNVSMYGEDDRRLSCRKCYGMPSSDCVYRKKEEILALFQPTDD